jgi:hypothetical protein
MWRGGVSVALAYVALAIGWTLPSAAQQPATEGTVAGVVLDKSSGDPIIEAGVEVLGQKRTVRTDLDGRFKIALPPGTYELRIYAPLYQGRS